MLQSEEGSNPNCLKVQYSSMRNLQFVLPLSIYKNLNSSYKLRKGSYKKHCQRTFFEKVSTNYNRCHEIFTSTLVGCENKIIFAGVWNRCWQEKLSLSYQVVFVQQQGVLKTSVHKRTVSGDHSLGRWSLPRKVKSLKSLRLLSACYSQSWIFLSTSDILETQV